MSIHFVNCWVKNTCTDWGITLLRIGYYRDTAGKHYFVTLLGFGLVLNIKSCGNSFQSKSY